MWKFWKGLKAGSEMGIVRFSSKSWVNVATLKLGKKHGLWQQRKNMKSTDHFWNKIKDGFPRPINT